MKKIEFDSLKTRRATDIIENRISHMIIGGTIKPGDKLPTEKELSEQFDVSIVTVREALRGLEVAGLIEKKRGKGGGIYATEINNDSIKTALHNFLSRTKFTAKHLAQVRFSVEPNIVRIVAKQITPDELLTLDNNLTYCEKKLEQVTESIQLQDYHAIGTKNLEFHRIITEDTHNPVFALITDYILDFIPNLKKSYFTPDIKFCKQIANDHREIFNSLKAGNAKEAANKMLLHLKYLETYQMDEDLVISTPKGG
jgi:GntR family transcriptional regulator, transcriptional repressor for pyruvate dehydrogenase complex